MSFICFRTVDCDQEENQRQFHFPVRSLVSTGRARKSTDLARFTSTEQKHFDLILCQHTVPLQLALNLIIACEDPRGNQPWAGIY
jgi:hypothetical protein